MWKYITSVAFVTASSLAIASGTPRIGFGAYGNLHVGMSEQAIAQVTGEPVRHLAPELEEEKCFYGSVPGLPDGMSLMFLDGHLARIDVFDPGTRMWSGAEVGMSESSLKRLYDAKLEQTPHAYAGPEGHYFTLLSADQTMGIRFETDGAEITGYYSGTAEAIQYIEGCQ